jgi:two-component sensor histidine kinase/CheY-like chemotaxis protein
MKKKLKILILEDVVFDAELIEYELRREGVEFLSKRVETEENYIRALEELKPDLILADHSLPKFDGLSALKIANERFPYIPFLFVSGKIGEEFAVSALKEGATDYIFKNNLSKLVPAIQRALNESHEQVEREKAEKALREAHFELEQQVLERTEALARANKGLRLEMDERRRIEDKLKKSLEEKEILLKEIHHRVKNNMQIISSLLNLQSRHLTDEKTVNVLKESRNRVKSMAMVHEELYRSNDLSKIDFAEYIQRLLSGLFSSYGVDQNYIKPKINVGNILLDIGNAVPCGLIIIELVSNSLKHAFKHGKKGIISTKFYLNGSKHVLIVADDGTGFPEDIDFKNTKTLGLQLVNTLVKQLHGSINISRNNGTLFKIIF